MDNARWLDKLATITGLKECPLNDSPKLIFLNKDAKNDPIGDAGFSGLRSEEWVSYDLKITRIWYHPGSANIICELSNDGSSDNIEYANMWNSLQAIYLRSIHKGGLPFHAGLAELDGRGVLLAAPGDTGKSTCCRRLPDYWKPLCDDEALVVLDNQKNYHTHPFPTWSDYFFERSKNTWNVQYSVPLFGIFFLEQSKTNEAVSLRKTEATAFINESASQICQRLWRRMDVMDQRNLRMKLFNNAIEMAKALPVFLLRVSLHGRFWEEIEKALGW